MAAADLIVDVHHHYLPPPLFDHLAARATGKRIVTSELSLTLRRTSESWTRREWAWRF
jgi:hypothetical protein